MSIMQESQWEIIGLGDFLVQIEEGMKDPPRYNLFSNVKYLT